MHQVPVRTAPAVALGFFVMGCLCLLASLFIAWVHPSVAFGDPWRVEVIALGALLAFGCVASFIFAAAYALSPIMATSSLYSDRLALWHLALHGTGMGWLVVFYGGMPVFGTEWTGFQAGILMLITGVVLNIFNLLCTSARYNRWEPEQLTILSALFWLGIIAVLGIVLILARGVSITGHQPIQLLSAHGPMALIGFIWLSLLGFALKLFNMFLVSRKTAGALSWSGWVLINGALMTSVPVLLILDGKGWQVAMTLLALGSILYLLDIIRLWLAADRPFDWALTGAFVGLLSGVAVLLQGIIFAPDTTWILFSAVLGSFSLVMLGLTLRLVPFLVWQLRCVAVVSNVEMPGPQHCVHKGAGIGLSICGCAGVAYFFAGQFTQSAVGAQLGALCMLCAMFWLMYGISPAFKAFIFGIQTSQIKPL